MPCPSYSSYGQTKYACIKAYIDKRPNLAPSNKDSRYEAPTRLSYNITAATSNCDCLELATRELLPDQYRI